MNGICRIVEVCWIVSEIWWNGNWLIWLNGKWNMIKIWLKLMVICYMIEIWLICNEILWLKYEWMVNEIWIKYDCN